MSALNISLAPKFEGKVGVGLFDKDFTFVKSLVEGNVALKNAYGVRLNSTIGFDAATFFDGASYYVALYAYSPETGYSIVRTEKGLEDYYLATVKDGTVTFEPMKKMGDETPVAGEVVTGLYNGRATNGEGKALTWQVNVWKDGQESGKYWIANLDPMARNKGFSYDKGWNKVYGYASANGSKIDIPVDQTVGTNLRLRNYSGGDNITLYLSAKEKKMSIDDVWGAVELDNGAENATVSEFSRYSGTSFEFTTVSEDGGEQNVPNPVISVSEEHLLTISCSAPEAAIYYTLDGTRPSVGGTRYVSPLTLTENGIVKAIAVKDGLSSEVVTYEVTDFVCATPQISQAGKSNKVNISCATPGVRICYTLDNSIPTAASATYTGEFEITKSCIVKAIAIRNNYNQSAIASRSVIYYQAETPQPGSGEVIVEGNVAGGLANRVSEADISSATRWIISGELNGTDFKLLRQVMENGRITDLDLGNAIIVSGGEPYYSNYGTEYSTENNVVGPNMFYKAHSLISLRLPSTTRAIGRYALQGCDNLASISIPDQCESVEGSAIWSCDHLASIHIGREVRSFEGDNGNMCPALAEITVDERNEYFRTVGGVLFNKDMTRLHKYPVARAGSEYVVPDPVKAIGEDAFYGAQLEGISLPGTLTEIQSNAFSKCSHLKAIDLPADVTALGTFAFMNCSSLSTIDIPDGVEELGMFCFGYCANLRECRLGASVRKIESSAFTGATSLQAFSVAAINTSFTASKGILYSKDMSRLVRCPLALYSEELFVPDGVTVIESDAFASCGNIAKSVLPEGLEKIGSSAFKHCSMKEINIPNSVSEIGMFAFQECNSLQSFAIPDGVKEIKLYLLYDCDELSYVYIPAGVTVIEGNAFSRSRKLATIESRIADIDKVEVEAGHDGNYSQFNNIPADCTWHVPAGCAENYKAQPWWVPTWKVMDDLSTGISSRPAEESLSLRAADGLLVITAGADAVVSIFNAAGVLAGKVEVKRGMTRSINLPAGVYIVSGQKILIK